MSLISKAKSLFTPSKDSATPSTFYQRHKQIGRIVTNGDSQTFEAKTGNGTTDNGWFRQQFPQTNGELTRGKPGRKVWVSNAHPGDRETLVAAIGLDTTGQSMNNRSKLAEDCLLITETKDKEDKKVRHCQVAKFKGSYSKHYRSTPIYPPIWGSDPPTNDESKLNVHGTILKPRLLEYSALCLKDQSQLRDWTTNLYVIEGTVAAWTEKSEFGGTTTLHWVTEETHGTSKNESNAGGSTVPNA